MANVFLCHNLMAIYKTIIINSQFAEGISKIYYLDYSVRVNIKLLESLQVELISSKTQSGNWVKRTINTAKYKNKICSEILNDLGERDNLYVFLDNVLLFSSIIETIKKKRKNCSIVLIEEGAGLYTKPEAKKPYNDRAVLLKKVIYSALGLSTYSINRRKQGENQFIDTIICSDAEKYKKTGKYKGQTLVEYKDIFSKMNCDRFLQMLPCEYLKEIERLKKYNFVFLSEPIDDVVGKEMAEELIQKVVSILKRHGSVLFKPHPRDASDYTNIVDSSVSLFPGILRQIPFECLTHYLYDSRLITFHSSVVINISTKEKPILLYKLLNSAYINSVVDNSGFDYSKLTVVSTMDDLEKALC